MRGLNPTFTSTSRSLHPVTLHKRHQRTWKHHSCNVLSSKLPSPKAVCGISQFVHKVSKSWWNFTIWNSQTPAKWTHTYITRSKMREVLISGTLKIVYWSSLVSWWNFCKWRVSQCTRSVKAGETVETGTPRAQRSRLTLTAGDPKSRKLLTVGQLFKLDAGHH